MTDSTSDINSETAGDMGIAVVPQYSQISEDGPYKDNIPITPDEFYRTPSAAPELPKTSPASPGRVKPVYDELSRDAHEILTFHISSRTSASSNSASQGTPATPSDCRIKVIDSGQAQTGLDTVAVAAAELAMQSARQQQVVTTAASAARRAQSSVHSRNVNSYHIITQDSENPYVKFTVRGLC